MAGVWWKSTTQPDEPCRKTATKHGWLAGLLYLGGTRFLQYARSAVQVSLWLALIAVLTGAKPTSAPSALLPGEGEEIVARMEHANAQRREGLRSYVSRRRYTATNPRLRRKAYMVVEARFEAPDGKRFRVVERGGSQSVERRVFVPLLETEQANARSPAREVVEICRRNYTFAYLEYDTAAGAHVFQAEPRTVNKYLFRGKIWINPYDFGIQRIEGEPAQRPSFWVRRTHFVHDYAKFGDFWFPVHNRTEVELRLFGRSTMGIDYFDYDWQPRTESARSGQSFPLATLPVTVAASPEARY